jgi:hypothetical protein
MHASADYYVTNGGHRIEVIKAEKLSKIETTTDILNNIIKNGCPLDRGRYFAYMYGPPEWWPNDEDAALPGVLKTVSEDDRVGAVKGSA